MLLECYECTATACYECIPSVGGASLNISAHEARSSSKVVLKGQKHAVRVRLLYTLRSEHVLCQHPSTDRVLAKFRLCMQVYVPQVALV